MYVFLADTDIVMYDLFGYISFVAVVVFNLAQIKTKKSNVGNVSLFITNRVLKLKSSASLWIFAIIELLFVSVFQGAFTGVINNAFGEWVGTGGNYFGTLFWGPIILFLWFYIVGVNPFKEMDLITPAYSLRLIFAKLACFCAGCCRGIKCSWGLYYPEQNDVLFPAQLLEAMVSLIIFICFMKYRKKAEEGTLFPIYMIIYCATRFLTEFTRGEENVFLILKRYHILCFIGILVGVVWLVIVKKYSDKIVGLYEKAPLPFLKNISKIDKKQSIRH